MDRFYPLILILTASGALLSGVWLFISFTLWVAANWFIGLGHGQFIGPSAHNKEFIRNILVVKAGFETHVVNMLCFFLFCVILFVQVYSRL